MLVFEKYRKLEQFWCIEVNPARGKPTICRHCNGQVGKGELRIRHLVCTNKCNQDQGHRSPIDACGKYHIRCFLNLQVEKTELFTNTNEEFTLIQSTRQIAGFDELTVAQKTILIDAIGPRKRSLNDASRRERLSLTPSSSTAADA